MEAKALFMIMASPEYFGRLNTGLAERLQSNIRIMTGYYIFLVNY
jgi:hypothetical protein